MNCRLRLPQIVCFAAGTLVFLATLPANAGPLAGAKTCGPYVKRAPSTLGSSGSGMVSTAIAAKELADLRDALICLINAERTSTGKQALARNRQLDMAVLGHTSEASDSSGGEAAIRMSIPIRAHAMPARLFRNGYATQGIALPARRE